MGSGMSVYNVVKAYDETKYLKCYSEKENMPKREVGGDYTLETTHTQEKSLDKSKCDLLRNYLLAAKLKNNVPTYEDNNNVYKFYSAYIIPRLIIINHLNKYSSNFRIELCSGTFFNFHNSFTNV